MNMRSVLHHALGIGSLCLMFALLYAAHYFREREMTLFLIVAAFAPGYHALRYIRGFGWRAR